MSVEFHATSVSNMDYDDSNIGYSKFFGEGNNFRYTVFAWRNSPYKVATICLGLLCVLLLAGVISQNIYHQKVVQENQNNINSQGQEKEELSINLKAAQKARNDLVAQEQVWQGKVQSLNSKVDRMEVNNNILIDETNKLKTKQSQLQATNKNLTKTVEQLRAGKSHAETNNQVLSNAKDELQKKYNLVVKRRDELLVSHDAVSKERDNLQNKFNNVTRSREKLQTNYNDLIKELEHLQDRYNASTRDKDKMASGHQDMAAEKAVLQENFDALKKVTDTLQQNYASLAQEKKELESRCTNVTAERQRLELRLGNLTAERDDLLATVDRLNNSIQAKKCPSGWQKFENSCYLTMNMKKTWAQSRAHCISRGADLVIIQSEAEMHFMNSLFSSDKEVWIGLTDDGVEGQWKWVDGSPMTIPFWGAGQPNSYNGRDQDCVEFWHRASGNGEWNDENCNLEQQWVCEV